MKRLERLLSSPCFSDQLHARLLIDDQPQARPDDRERLDQHNRDM
jgi:hypothetical protein